MPKFNSSKMTNVIVGLLVVITVGLAIYLLSYQQSENAQVDTRSASTSSKDTPVVSDTEEVVPMSENPENSAGQYVDYDSKLVSSTEGIKVLFFHASWCPTCKALDQNIRAGKVPDGVTIFKVDYDKEDNLKSKYGITYQHTLVQIDDSGKELKKWYGSYTIEQIMDQVL